MHNTKIVILGLTLSVLLAGCAIDRGTTPLNNDLHTQANQTKPIDPNRAIHFQCSAELLRPARFREQVLQVLVYDGSTSYTNIPAEIAWQTTKIQVEPARYAQETEAAQYEEIEEVIEVERKRSELYASPAKYHTVNREVLVKPAHQRWKTACLATANHTCIDQVDAAFTKISTQLIAEPAQIKQRTLPTQTITLKRKKLIKAGKGSGPILPARYATVRLLRVSKPWKIITHLSPPQYLSHSTYRKLNDEKVVSLPVACTEKLSSAQITLIQQALLQQGQRLTLSGNLDTTTRAALHRFQAANNLAIGAITLETLRKLGLA